MVVYVCVKAGLGVLRSSDFDAVRPPHTKARLRRVADLGTPSQQTQRFDRCNPRRRYQDGVRECEYFRHTDSDAGVAAEAAVRRASNGEVEFAEGEVDPRVVLLETYNPVFATGNFLNTAEITQLRGVPEAS